MKKSSILSNLSGIPVLVSRTGTAFLILITPLLISSPQAQAQVSLSGSGYSQDFNSIGSGLPEGWSVWEGASEVDVGSVSSLNTTPTAWSSSSSGFKNYASSDGLSLDSSSAEQSGSLNRALGVRSTGSFGDPGAGFMFSVADTLGLGNFGLSFDALILDEENRSTEWTLDYRVGDSGFVALDTFTLDSFGSQTFSYDLGNAVDNLGASLDFRIGSFSNSIGTGSRDTFAIDNFQVSFTPVPEPEEYMLVSGLILAVFAVFRKRKSAPCAVSQEG